MIHSFHLFIHNALWNSIDHKKTYATIGTEKLMAFSLMLKKLKSLNQLKISSVNKYMDWKLIARMLFALKRLIIEVIVWEFRENLKTNMISRYPITIKFSLHLNKTIWTYRVSINGLIEIIKLNSIRSLLNNKHKVHISTQETEIGLFIGPNLKLLLRSNKL